MTPTITLHEGDCRVSLRRLIDEGVRVHSVVTDAPYGLVSVTKRFGKDGAAPAKHGTDGAFARASKGFMGKQWDGTGIERDPEFWRLIYEILLPGGMVFAFSGARTGHWQACAMEMAGFIMHPMHGWLYGSGMPKAHNPVKHIDALKLMGGARTTDIRQMEMGDDYEPSGRGRVNYDNGGGSKMNGHVGPYEPKTPEAARWGGWRYGTQTQKPALEPVYLGQKPFSEKNGALNLLKHGVGAFNIDDCRAPTTGEGRHREGEASQERRYDERGATNFARTPGPRGGAPEGRWPANLLHDGSEAVRAIFPDSKGQLAKASTSDTQRAGQNTYGAMARGSNGAEPRDDTGSAARFFNSFPTTEEDYLWTIDAGLIDDPEMTPAIYHGKATKADRAGSRHPTVKPISLMEHFIRHITPPGGTVLDPFAGSGTTAEAARRLGMNAIIMEAEPDYIVFLRERFNLASQPNRDPLSDLLGVCPQAPVDNDLAHLLG